MTDTAAELVVDVTARESVAAVLQRLEAQLGQTNSVAERLAGALEARLGASQAKAGRDTLTHAQAQARLQSTAGDTAGAIRTLQSALEGVDRSSVAAIRVETQLIGLQNKLGKELSGSSQFADAFKQGLFGFVAPAAAAQLALDGLRATVQSFVAAFQLKANLDATTASIKSQLDGFRDADATYSEAVAFGRQYNITQKETNDILSSSTDILRTSGASVGELETALIRLQSRDVSKPISEASRALRELVSGDTTSIKELFQVSAQDANRMKAEILAGGDAVQVLTAFLDRAQIGMGALEQRTQGTVGKLNELALAQEDLALAQAAWAEGPGLAILETRVAATRGLTRLLSGDFGTMGQSITQAANEGSFGFQLFNTLLGGSLQTIANYTNEANAAAAATAGWTAAGGDAIVTSAAMTDIEQQRAQTLTAAAEAQAAAVAAAAAHAAALDQDAAKSLLASVGTEELAIKKQQLAAQAQAAAQAVLASGGNIAATTARLAASSSLVDQLTAAYLRLAQAQGAAGAAAASNRVPADAQRALGIAQQSAAALDRQRALSSDLANAERDLAAARRIYGASSQQAYAAETRALKARQSAAGRGGGGGGGGRRGEQQKLQQQLQADQEQANTRLQQAEADHAEKLLAIQAEYARDRLAAEESLQQSLLEGGASFYDALINMENQGAAHAADAQYQAFLANELPKIAAEQGADVAEAYQKAYEQTLLARAKRQAEIEKAQAEGDTARAEALRGVDEKYRAAEDAKLAKIKEGNDSIAAEHDRALAEEQARYDEASGNIADSADRAADRKIAAAERAGKAIDAEQAQLDKLATTYDRVAPARGSGAPPAAAAAAPPATTAVPAGESVPEAQAVHDATVASALVGVREALDRVERAVKDGAGRVASAVQGGIR